MYNLRIEIKVVAVRRTQRCHNRVMTGRLEVVVRIHLVTFGSAGGRLLTALLAGHLSGARRWQRHDTSIFFVDAFLVVHFGLEDRRS